MIILTTPQLLTTVTRMIARLYPGTITAVPAPGDENRWFVLQDGYVLPGLHITKRDDRYVFGTITP